jgi:hypothetical protein
MADNRPQMFRGSDVAIGSKAEVSALPRRGRFTPPITDINHRPCHVRLVPKAEDRPTPFAQLDPKDRNPQSGSSMYGCRVSAYCETGEDR